MKNETTVRHRWWRKNARSTDAFGFFCFVGSACAGERLLHQEVLLVVEGRAGEDNWNQ